MEKNSNLNKIIHMERKSITEQHYIVIGSRRYQIIFDARSCHHDILIRGLFKWSPIDSAQFSQIEFLLDNLSTVDTPHTINRTVWCSELNRIELHISKNDDTELRSQQTLSIPEGFDLETERQIELVLRIYPEAEPREDCEPFILPEPNESWESTDLPPDKQKDKDGSILIGTRIFLP